jgi:transcriptional regulator with XRE-family HTH domain
MRPTPEQIFGKVVSERRQHCGLSQEELGFKAGVHRTYVSQIERGLKSPTLNVILRFAKALELSAGQLVGKVEEKT